MKQLKRLYLLFIPIAVSLVITLILYSRLPDQIPSHWNISGEIDSYKPRYFVILTALLPALFVWLLTVIPSLDPKSENFKQHQKAYNITVIFVVLFILAFHWYAIAAALGTLLKVEYLIKSTIGILFIIIGNYLPQAKQNYTYGIRTPWTLENEEVWRRTSRFGGRGFVICGFITLITLFLPSTASFWILSISLIILIFGIYLYSYLVYKKEEES